MIDIISTLNNRSPRYNIKNDSGLTVTIEMEDASCKSIDAQLLDISVGGARIKAKEMIPDEEVFAVRIEVEHPRRVIVVSGNVCWVTPAAGGHWSLGCRFTPPIPVEVLHDFAEAGILDRREYGRKDGRKRVSLRARVQWQLRSETSSVRIVNYSRGGYCLCSQVEGKPRERVLLQLESDAEQTILIPGEIKWQVESPDGFVIGCQFLDSRDFSVLSELLNPVPQVDSAGDQPKRHSLLRRSRRVIVACAAALLCLAIFQGLILSTRIHTSEATQIASSTDTSEAEARIAKKLDPRHGNATRDPTREATLAAEADADSSPAILVAARLNENDDALDIDRTRGSTLGVVDENGPVEATAGQAMDSPPAHEATLATAGNDSPDAVSDRRGQEVTTDAHKQEHHPSETTASNNAAGAKDDPETIAASPDGYRTWVDVTGRYRVVARIVTVENNVIRLRNKNGQLVSVPLDRLSQDDARFVRRWYPASQ